MSSPKILVYLLRRDLRLSDNPVFHELCKLYSSGTQAKFTHLLPLYVFPADQIEVSGFLTPSKDGQVPESPFPEARSAVGGYWRCGPHRAKFMAQSVWDLKQSLLAVGSDLLIRAGRSHEVVRDLLQQLEEKKDGSFNGEVIGLWMTGEVTAEEVTEEQKVRRVLQEKEKEFKIVTDEKYFLDEYVTP
jgi:deoxyribodipyrimidine photo-lyase